MARITPIDVIKGISGKYGNNSNDYFATNSSSNKIHLAKFSNPYKGPATEKQLAQREKFATKQAACTASQRQPPKREERTEGHRRLSARTEAKACLRLFQHQPGNLQIHGR